MIKIDQVNRKITKHENGVTRMGCFLPQALGQRGGVVKERDGFEVRDQILNLFVP